MSLKSSTLYNVDGLVALITGGGTGLGLIMTKALVQNGASKVYILGDVLEPLQAAAASVGPQVVPIHCDVTSKKQLEQAVQTVKNDAGFLNILVCNAGVGGPGGVFFQKELSAQEFAARNFALDAGAYLNTFNVNVVGSWYTAMAFLALLDAGNKRGNVSQSSQVIVIGSAAGLVKDGTAGWAYGQSKAATIHLCKQLSTLLPRWKMRANCITPGLFSTGLGAPLASLWKQADNTYGKALAKMLPLGRLGDEQDLGGTLLYLASRAGAYANGSIMVLDGAGTSRQPSVL